MYLGSYAFAAAACALHLTAKGWAVDAAPDHGQAVEIKRSFVNVLDNATIEVLKECKDTSDRYTLFDVHSPANNRSPPMHHHTVYQESVQVLSGVLYFESQGEDKKSTDKIVELQAGDDFHLPANHVHKWWTEGEPSAFRVTMTPCFDGFHEGLELLAKVATPTSSSDQERAIVDQQQSLYKGWSILQKTRFHSLLWVMMATELDEGLLASAVGFVLRKIAARKSTQRMEVDLRHLFLPQSTAASAAKSTSDSSAEDEM